MSLSEGHAAFGDLLRKADEAREETGCAKDQEETSYVALPLVFN
jgi:hypothetical protein